MCIPDEAAQAMVQASQMDGEVREPRLVGQGMQMSAMGPTCACGGKAKHGSRGRMPYGPHGGHRQEDSGDMEEGPEFGMAQIPDEEEIRRGKRAAVQVA